MIIDAVLEYEELRKLNDIELEEYLSTYFNDDIYGFSLSWRDNQKYILKVCCKYGDKIVDWK